MKNSKLLKFPIIKQIYDYIENKQFDKEMKEYKEDYINKNEIEDMLFVWGILSHDDLSGNSKASLHTMNDLDLIYHKDEKKYSLGVETLYFFTKDVQYKYIRHLFDEFTKWMNENNYNTTKEFALSEVFTNGININTKFNSIEEAYAAFKMLVNGFCSLYKTN